MSDFAGYLQRMGGLHDAEVAGVAWRPSEGSLEIRLDDVYANFRGLPEYPGLESGSIVFSGVGALEMSLEHAERLRIYEITAGDDGAASVAFSPAGRVSLRFGEASYPPCRLRG
ncbi:MAG: hypothetical protein AVDCRST_MAG68-3642 [uncultured Gemmatimonadetes bacterium]|uniref:Uncharacterized protein n=1 Tax=uncultured Gemmatimonadota bacterium TaxID=203437 RepID=A0A6J4M5L5_9BACT|nr:MAG: hypothetical protein AVDCRST_MAG68-3642 [uncultured Gemmatimonadota bacterium]